MGCRFQYAQCRQSRIGNYLRANFMLRTDQQPPPSVLVEEGFRMPRYFFHVRRGGLTVVDREGDERCRYRGSGGSGATGTRKLQCGTL